MNTETIKLEVERQFNIIKRGTEEIISEYELKEKLTNSVKTNIPLKIKFGIDPTGSEIHLGHTVIIKKLRAFQDLGHTVQFLIGSYTAQVGDPTGKSETRKVLTRETINENMKNYLDQAGRILDIDKLEISYNHTWLEKLTMEDILKLMSNFTVALMTSREDFANRLKANKPVSLMEFMYPIMQGYDSVALNCDVEIGGTDQTFNLLRGRDLLKANGKDPQICITLPILEGTDGKNKMSKSLNNYIGLEDNANDMYGKTMSIPDSLIIKYFKLLTDVSGDEINKMEQELKEDKINPMLYKKKLAFEIVKFYHDENLANDATKYFRDLFSKKINPDDIKEIEISPCKINIIDLLCDQLKFCKTRSDARRLIKGNAVKINDEKISDVNLDVEIKSGMIIKSGKKNIVKIKG